MKIFNRLVLLLVLNIWCIQSYAQFKLSGKILDYDGKAELKINIPLVFGFYKENSVQIPVEKDGSFNIVLPIKESKFANLIYKRTFHTLLLNPNKTLTTNLKDTTLTLISGIALPENNVMQKVNVEEYPFFFKNDGGNEFSNLSFLQLKEQVLNPYFTQRDEKIKIVNASTIAAKYKLLIVTELKSIAYNYINDYARTQVSNKRVVDSLILQVFDRADLKPLTFPAGPQYFAFVDNYIRFLETKAFVKIKAEQIPSNQPIPYFGISLDSANVIVKKFDKNYWRWIGATHNFPLNIVEKYTYQQLVNLYNNKELRPFKGLSSAFNNQFPQSIHYQDILSKTNSLHKMLSENETNANIQIATGFEKLNSIAELIQSYKGKVVYLDIWGTWCGPCKEELAFIPELKTRFKGKDVVFIYLDMDEEDKDSSWREFIKINKMEGIHLRKNRQTIAPIWKELLANAKDKAEYYPQYFIFDKDGKLAVTKALRPSSKEALYTQLENYLK
ncbi:TlpA family protein disulfide reductase [Pedobacter polaris]|uniref:TlpA family protein disulfide reductase n=1 Tax=Pedobacter polaris TaxID=2571273 RepID=A0A4U1CHH2_9SPHI|nr:TlpA disulfide reductase family protein [Pedobacter polaris]TKC05400.1 TlpA family protein disulfide reductase [Pedobacter polaris]